MGGHRTTSLALAPDGKQLALAVEDERGVRLFDAGAREPRLSIKACQTWGLRPVAFSRDSELVASTDGPDVRLWSTKTGELVRTLDPAGIPGRTRWGPAYSCIAFSPTRPQIALGRATGFVHVCDISSGQCLLTLENPRSHVNHIAFSADGNLLAVADGDRNPAPGRDKAPVVAVYEIATGELVGQFKLPEGMAHSAAFSPDGRLLAAGADGGKNAVHLWDVYTGQEVAALEGHSAGVLSVAFSPDGKLLASGSLDTTILLWDVRKAVGKRTAPA